MAVNLSRTGWLELFRQRRSPNGFLQSHFTVKPGGFYNGDTIVLDIQRFNEDIAVAVTPGQAGNRLNDADQFTTKEFKPPAFNEEIILNVVDLVSRMAGTDPFSASYKSFAAQMVKYMLLGFTLIDDKIKRSVELQAAQILQTGKVELRDANNNIVYALDFLPKPSHFPSAGTAWNAAGADPIADLEALAKVIRADGKVTPNRLVMGDRSMVAFLQNENVRNFLDNRRYRVGMIEPRFENSGATMYDHVWIGSYRFELWTYPDTYIKPETGTVVPFVDENKVIMMSDKTRLDRVSAQVPLPLGPDPRVEGLLPGRLSNSADAFDVTPNVWSSPDGKQIFGSLESRTLLIPAQIDGFGALNTGV